MILDINNRDHLSLISAVRGPDALNCSTIKLIFTARIRKLIGISTDNGIVAVRHRGWRATLPDPVMIMGEAKRAGNHYWSHILDALIVLKNMKRIERSEYDFLYHFAMTLKHSAMSKKTERLMTAIRNMIDQLAQQ